MKQHTFVYDPTTPEFQVDMHDIYRVLRDHYPLHHDVAHGFYALSRFDDVWAAVHDTVTFSSVVSEADALMPQADHLVDVLPSDAESNRFFNAARFCA